MGSALGVYGLGFAGALFFKGAVGLSLASASEGAGLGFELWGLP